MARKKKKKKSKIKIKPSKVGSFTSYCKRKGYSGVTSACIAQGKRSRSTSIRRKATFAQNSKRWSKKR